MPQPAKQTGRLHLPLYPKAFVAAAKLHRKTGRVFVAMPFEAAHSKTLWTLIQSVCRIHELEPRRADTSDYPRAIVADILEELETAEIIIADLTGLNPNVLYEVGIAHVRCDSVVLLCRRGQGLPFDLASIRCLFFDLSTIEKKEELTQRLGRTIESLRKPATTTVIEKHLDRTLSIIADLKLLADLPDEELRNEAIWFSGFLSSFGISAEESYPADEREYHKALLQERDLLLKLARRGCPIKCIITPPSKDDLLVDSLPQSIQRLKTLIKFLQGTDSALQHTDWVISPYRQKNFYVIGHICFSEGFKAGRERGFSLTLRQDDPQALNSTTDLHQKLFERLREYTLSAYPPPHSPHTDERQRLRSATIQCLKASLEYCQAIQRIPAKNLQAKAEPSPKATKARAAGAIGM